MCKFFLSFWSFLEHRLLVRPPHAATPLRSLCCPAEQDKVALLSQNRIMQDRGSDVLDWLAIICSPLWGCMRGYAGWKVVYVPSGVVSGVYSGTTVQYAGYHKVWDVPAVLAVLWVRVTWDMNRGGDIEFSIELERTASLAVLKA